MLKVGRPIDYLKKEKISSEALEEVRHVKQIALQQKALRFKRSDDNPELPENFEVGQAIGGGDCFFDSVAKGLKQLKPNMEFTVKSLRKVCKDLAVGNQQLKNKIVKDARNRHDPTIIIPDDSVSDDELWNAYLASIEYTSDDINKMQVDNPSLYQSLISLKYGSTLQVPIWGRPDIDGQLICNEYNIKLHTVEKLPYAGWSNQVLDGSVFRSVDSVDYNDVNTIHIVNEGKGHFKPILNTQRIQHKRQSPDPSDYDDEIMPEKELINIIKGRNSEEEKLLKIKRLFEEEPKPDINFQDENKDTLLHIAVRKKELKVIEWLVKNGAKIDIKNSRGRTQLEVAQHLGRQDIVEILKSHVQQNLQASAQQPSTQQKRTRTDSEEDKSEDSNPKRPRTSLQAAEESRGRKRTQNEESELGDGQVKKLKTSEGYPASGLKSSLHGTVYQLKLLMLFLKRGLDQRYSFDLATEMDAAEKFDDVVFQYTEGGEKVYRFLQAKHKQDDNKKITVNDLLTEQDDEFSLQKYFISYRKIKQNPEFKGYKLKDFVICTNIDLGENLRNSFEPIEGEDNILVFNGKKSERLKLKVDKFYSEKDLVSRLRKTSELNRLAKRLAKCVLENEPLDLKDNLFRSYHGVLGEKVIDVKNVEQRKEKDNKGKEVKKSYAKFHNNFLDGSSQELENFRSAFLKAYQEMSKEQMNVNEFWQKMKTRKLQISQTFGKMFELDIDPQLTDSEEFAKAITNAMSVAEQDVVNIKREKGKGIIKDNINKLAGHVLIKKGDKEKDTYYFSSAFFDDDNKLPGNLESFKNELKAELESKSIEFDRNKYKFHIANFKTCEEEQLHLKPFLPDDYIAEGEIKSFFEKLVFAVNQPNEVELSNIIKAEMGEDKDINLIDSELIASKFQEDMLNWMKEKKGRFFTREDGKAFFKEAKQKISKLVLIGPTLEYRAKIEEFGISFSKELSELSNFLNTQGRKIFNLVNMHKTILSSIKVYQTLKDIHEYQKDDSYIFIRLSSLLRIQDRVIKAFESRISNNLLVIECKAAEKNVDELYSQLSKVTRSSDSKKIILITQENDLLASKFKDNFSGDDKYEEKIDKKNGLTDLTIESQKKLLEEGKVIFQGEEVSLRTLVDDGSKDLLDGKVLSKLINNEKIEIGKALIDSKYEDIKDYYIDRTFNRHVKIKEGLKQRESKLLLTNSGQVDGQNLKEDQDIVLISDTSENFKDLCNKYKKHNIHWLKEEGNDLIWQQSYGALSKLRKFIDENEQAIQEYKLKKITDITDRVVIIATEPGMGKSTVLTHLAAKTKGFNPSFLWIVRINLLDYSTQLKRETEKKTKLNKAEAIKFLYRIVGFQLFQEQKEETTEKKKKREQTIEKVLSAITVKDSEVSLEGAGEEIKGLNLLEIGLFNNFYNQGRIALLFDGFDEISPKYTEKVIELLQVLKNSEVKKLWITTRPYNFIQAKLEDQLSIFSYSLKPFLPKEQKVFLRKFWKAELKLNELDKQRSGVFIDELLDKLPRAVGDKGFLSIPLHSFMVGKVFKDAFKSFYDSNDQELSDEHKRKIEEQNLITLYGRFIDIKFYEIRFREKKTGMNIDDPDMEEMVEEERKKFIENHMKLALYEMFNKNEVEKLLSRGEMGKVSELIDKITRGNEKTGLIERVTDSKPRFVHRTFAEYFASKLIYAKLHYSQESKQEIWEFFLDHILIDDKYNVIRRFIDCQLTDSKLFELKIGNTVEKLLEERIYKREITQLHVAAEEGLLETIKFLLNSLPNGDYINAEDNLGSTPLHCAVRNGHLEIIELLLERGADVNAKTAMGFTPLHSAVEGLKIGHEKVVKLLLEKGADINVKTENDETPLERLERFKSYEASNRFYKDRKVSNLIESNMLTVDKLEAMIIFYQNEKVIEEYESYISVPSEIILKSTQKLFAIVKSEELDEEQKIKQFKDLIGKKDGVVGATYDGNTLLHLAAFKGYPEIMKEVIACAKQNNPDGLSNFINAEVNTLTNKATALHLAAFFGHEKVVQTLLKVDGININAKDSQGYTPIDLCYELRLLGRADRNDHSKIIDLLCDRYDDYDVIMGLSLKFNADYFIRSIYNSQSERESNYKEVLNLLEKDWIKTKFLVEGLDVDLNIKKILAQLLQKANSNSYSNIIGSLIDHNADIDSNLEGISSLFEVGTCLGRRRRRNIDNCHFSWEDVDEFNEEKDEKRDFSKIKIDSEKFVSYIRDLPEGKQSQLIQLASGVKVTGESQSLVNKLIGNQKVMNHLSKVGKISGMTMHGMMAKNVLADFLNGNYQGVAINVGFIAGGQGFAKVAEAASLKGMKLASEGKLLLGRSLRAASPFLARGTSAFVIYDLVNQVKAFKNGTEEALVGVVGDSIYLGVDAAEIGVEVAEAFGVLEGVSSVTGPIGAAIGAVVFVGTDIYMAVKRVDKIDEIIHLTGKERFVEGLRAFIGMKPEPYIEDLMEKKQLYNQLVKQGLEYLKGHSNIQSYVFPTTDSKFKPNLDSKVVLDRKRTGIRWSRARPDDLNGGRVFCLPQGNDEPAPDYGSYLCESAIGVTDLSANKTGGYTLINLGEGKDNVKGFTDSRNIFVVNNGSKEYYGGNKDDIFVLQAGYVKGYLSGEGGINTLDTTSFAFQEEPLNIQLDIGEIVDYSRDNWLRVCDINKVIGRKNRAETITVSCNGCNSNVKLIDGQSGNKEIKDKINIVDNHCSYQMQVIVRPNTVIYNRALEGNFDYLVPLNEGGSAEFIFGPERFNVNNTFWFGYEPVDIKSINVRYVNIFNRTEHEVKFNFIKSEKEFNVTIPYAENPSYRLGKNGEIKIGNKDNLYMLQSSNESSEEIIKNYLPLASRLNKMSFFIQSLLSNETVVIGSGNHEVIHNNPAYRSHLVGNGGENVYVIDSESKKFEVAIPEVIIYDLDIESSVDTIDLRNLVRQVRGKLSNQDHFQLKVLKSANDLLLKATIVEVKPTEDSSVSKMRKHEYCTVRLKDGVNWYNKTHVIVDNAPMKINLDNNEWSLKPLPLKFEKDKEVIIVTSQDIEENTELITPKRAGNYTFVRDHGSDLIITNAFNTQDDLCTIVLSKFYETPKMETLSIKFADKEIVLKDHQEQINTARDMNIVKKEHSDQVYNDVFNSVKSEPEVIMVADQPVTHKHRHSRHREQIRHRRSTTSSSTRPTAWINDLFSWVKNSVSGLLSSKPESTPSSISQVDARVDVNGTIMLFDLLIRKVTGQKYISTLDKSISPLEAQGYTLNIIKEFEKVVEQAAKDSKISMHRLNIDFVEIQKEVKGKIVSGKFDEISGVLKSYVEKGCPGKEAGKLSPKKFEKFIAQLNKGLLNQSIEQLLHNGDGRLEVDGVKEQKTNSGLQGYLSNVSVQGHLTQAKRGYNLIP